MNLIYQFSTDKIMNIGKIHVLYKFYPVVFENIVRKIIINPEKLCNTLSGNKLISKIY